MREALGQTTLAGPDGELNSDRAVRSLHLSIHTEGKRATVVVPLANGPTTLHLVNLGEVSNVEFAGPETPWRIDGGLTALIARGAPPVTER